MAFPSILRVLVVVSLLWISSGQAAYAHPWHELESPDLFFGSIEMTPQLFLTGIGLSFGFGAVHALAPGHGKTMVAAYLVGNRGTAKHAVLLGMITTIAHTLSVITLAILALVASQYVIPQQLYPVLSTLSGLTVLGVGLWLFYQSWLSQGTLRLELHLQAHTGAGSMHPHDVTHDHPQASEHSHSEHSHSDSGYVKTAIARCDCGHDHLPTLPEHLSINSLLALGIAGGMVPCPSALVLLLSAISFHQVAYGLVLVSGFSLGLASVLISLGLMVVYAKRWFEDLPNQAPWLTYLPMASASVIILTGLVLTGYAIMPTTVY